MFPLQQLLKYRRNGTIHGAGSCPWPPSSPSWKAPGKDMGPSEDSETEAGASGDSEEEAGASGDSGMEAGASGDSEQEVATETSPRTKARSAASVKHLVIN